MFENDEYVRVIVDAGVKAIETAGRPPGDYVQAFKDAGAASSTSA